MHKPIGSIFTLVGGGTPSTKDERYWGNGIPWFSSADIDRFGAIKYRKTVTELGVENSTTNIVGQGIVVVVTRVGLGKVALLPCDMCFSQDIQALIPKNTGEVFGPFVFYQLQYIMQSLRYKGQGTTISGITKKQLAEVNFYLPVHSEQERIVSKIEELFSKLDASVAELQTAKEKLKVYRQAVLEESLPYDSFGTISQYIESMGQGWSPKCANKNSIDDDVWAVIKTTAVQHGYFDYTENKILPDNLEPRNQHEISVGDILITRAGPRSRCGVCCLVRKTKKRLLNCDKVYQIKPNRDKILPEYMEYVLNSPRFLLEINHCKTGGNDSGVNLTQNRFLTIKIPVPPLNIQKKIVEQIESRLSMCDSIEQTIDTSLQQAEALRQSILKQAFDGELV